MIERIEGLPDGVLAIEAKGEVTGEDYERTIVPEVERMLSQHDKIRLLYVLGDEFDGFTAAAMWDDAKVGMGHPFSWERVAMVTDHDAYRHLVKVWGFLVPGKMRGFALAELEQAREWVAEGA